MSRALNLFESRRTCVGKGGEGRGGRDLPLLTKDQDFDGVEQTGNLGFAPSRSQASSGCAGGAVQGNPGTSGGGEAGHGQIELSSGGDGSTSPDSTHSDHGVNEILLSFVSLAKSGDCFFQICYPFSQSEAAVTASRRSGE